jgi:hypothetical protein
MKIKKLPTFIIIGVAKCGTTSLYYALGKHPKIHMANEKELYFFNKDNLYNKGMKYYKTLFPLCDLDEICGENTPFYLYFKNVPERIKKNIPNIKLIVLLRNPINRAYSHFYGYLRLCKLRNQKVISNNLKEFLKIIKENPTMPLNHRGRNLLTAGLYGEQIQRWLQYFSLNQFKIIKSEDFFYNPKNIVNEIFDFLEVKRYPIEIKHYLKSTESNKRTLGIEEYFPLDKETREILYNYYKDSNKLLYKLIKRDMQWKA